MSAVPTPRYQIDQSVWKASTQRKTAQLPCPDCLGSRLWAVRTPAGTQMTTPCQRCAPRYGMNRTPGNSKIPSLMVEVFTPTVSCLTIGSVRIDTAANAREQVAYMCREAGIGSGGVYYEPDLSESREEAEASAAEMCVAKNTAAHEEPEALAAREFAGLAIAPAFRVADWNSVYQAWAVAHWHRETVDTVIENEDKSYNTADAIREYMEERTDGLKRYDFIDRHPFEGLLAAGIRSNDTVIRDIASALYCKFPSGDDARESQDREIVA